MQSARQIARLNETELQKCIPPSASWHTDYRDTAYIHIGGLPFELSEGDVLTIFSQYGNPVHVNLVRDKETGKSRGFAFLKYEDQRSCDLAVDNLSGAGVLGRVLAVDHCRYKLKEGEVEGEGMEDDVADEAADDTDREGEGRRKRRRRSRSESGSEKEEESRPMVREEMELAKLLKEHDEDDPMKEFLVKEKKEEVAEALKRLEVSKKEGSGRERNGERKRRHHRSRRHDFEDEEERRERHRARRHREKDDDRKDGHRSRCTEDEDERREMHRSRRDDDADDRVKDHRRSRRDDSEDEHCSRRRDEERRSKRERSAEREPERRNGHDRSRRDSREDDRRRRD